MKAILKFMLLVFLYSTVFTVANALMPFSSQMQALNVPTTDVMANLMKIPPMVIDTVWIVATICFVVKRANKKGIPLVLTVAGVIFFVQTFMTQIETLLFGGSFAITTVDILLIMAAGIFPVAAVTPLAVKFFANQEMVSIHDGIGVSTLVRILSLGGIYLVLYMLFGYFIAWQFEAVRLFYSGTAAKPTFLGQLAINFYTNPIIYPFQLIRGMLFASAMLPIRRLMTNRKDFMMSTFFLFMCPAIVLVVPNFLLPDAVRVAHLIEMSVSMALFAVITGFMLWEKRVNKHV